VEGFPGASTSRAQARTRISRGAGPAFGRWCARQILFATLLIAAGAPPELMDQEYCVVMADRTK